MKKLIACAATAALVVGLTTAPAQAASVEIDDGTCVIRIDRVSLLRMGYEITDVEPNYVGEDAIQFMTPAQARVFADYQDKHEDDFFGEEEVPDSVTNETDGVWGMQDIRPVPKTQEELKQEREDFRTYRGLLQKCIDGSTQSAEKNADSNADSSEGMSIPETVAIVMSVLALLTSIVGVAAPSLLPSLK